MSSQYSEDSMDIEDAPNGNKDDRQDWQQELSGLVERIVNSEAPRAQQHRDELISWRNRMLSKLGIGIRDGQPLGVCIRTKQDFEFVRDRLNDLLTALESRDKVSPTTLSLSSPRILITDVTAGLRGRRRKR